MRSHLPIAIDPTSMDKMFWKAGSRGRAVRPGGLTARL